MVRGNGSARAETSGKAAARPSTIRIRMRRGPLSDTLDDDLSTITISPFITSIALPLERSFSFGSGCAAEQAINDDAPNPLALLRTRCDRPCRSCAAERPNEFASFHRITSRQAGETAALRHFNAVYVCSGVKMRRTRIEVR